MKGKKYGIIVSVITMIVSLILIIFVNLCDKENYELLSNIFIGVFGSSVVTLIILISDYIVAKREALEDYYSQVYKIIVAFGKIKYVRITDTTLENVKYKTECELKECFGAEPPKMDDIIDYYDKNNYWNNYPENLSTEEKSRMVLEQIEKDCANIEKVLDSYLKFENLSYEKVENAFERISFLFDKAEKHLDNEKHFRIWIYRNLHDKLRNMIKTIRLENYHFKLYKEGENKNLFVVAQKINDLNKQLFEIVNDTNDDSEIEEIYAKFYNDMDSTLERFRARIYGCQPQEQMIVPIETRWNPKKVRSEHND